MTIETVSLGFVLPNMDDDLVGHAAPNLNIKVAVEMSMNTENANLKSKKGNVLLIRFPLETMWWCGDPLCTPQN